MHRFIGTFLLQPVETVVDQTIVHQVSQVLKLHVGEKLVLCDGTGREAAYEIQYLSSRELVLRREGESRDVVAQPKRDVTLYCSVLKKDHFELVVQKAVEVGVSVIVPLVTDRTVKLGVKEERLRLIAKEAAEQSGRGVVPEIRSPLVFSKALQHLPDPSQAAFLHMSGRPFSEFRLGDSVSLFIGPEGGWSEGEVLAATKKGCMIVSLGTGVLRAETAAIVGSYLLSFV